MEKTKMIYELVKQVKENGIGADGTVVCSMDELVALVDYVEELAYDDGYDEGHNDGYDQGYDEAYYEYCEDDEDGYKLGYANGFKAGYKEGCEDGRKDMFDACECNDDKPTLEDLFKELIVTQMAKGR